MISKLREELAARRLDVAQAKAFAAERHAEELAAKVKELEALLAQRAPERVGEDALGGGPTTHNISY